MVEYERMIKESLNEDFHKKIGGRKRNDLRFYAEPEAVKTRDLIDKIFQERHYGGSITDLAKEIGVSGGTLSLAIGGRAGEKPRKELEGMSSTNFVVFKLGQIIEKITFF